MDFKSTPLQGACLVALKKIEDERGFFARAWCRDEFEKHGLNANIVQVNTGYSGKCGTLRGMHYQESPYAEAKFVRCTRGSVYDVIIDLRTTSNTFGNWFGAELTEDNGHMLYVPEGFAHGYQTLADDTEISYMTTAVYSASAAKGVRYNDPLFAIEWPLPVSVISQADQSWPDFGPSN